MRGSANLEGGTNVKVDTGADGVDVSLDFGEMLALGVPPGTVPEGLTVWQLLITAVVKAGGGFDVGNCPPEGVEFSQGEDGGVRITFRFRDKEAGMPDE